jgi:hypothetical protein
MPVLHRASYQEPRGTKAPQQVRQQRLSEAFVNAWSLRSIVPVVKTAKSRAITARLPVLFSLRCFRSLVFNNGRCRLDFDLARLHRFGNFPDKINHQKTVLEVRRLYFDVIGKLETPLEGTPGYTAMEKVHTVGFIGTLANNDKLTVTHLDIKIPRTKAGDGDTDLIRIFAGFHDVVGRVGICRRTFLGGIEQSRHTVKAYGRAVKGGKIESSHSHILL